MLPGLDERRLAGKLVGIFVALVEHYQHFAVFGPVLKDRNEAGLERGNASRGRNYNRNPWHGIPF